jgi:translation initiation factor IF-1
MVEHYQD